MIARSDFFPALRPRKPFLRIDRMDRSVAWLAALLFCLSLLAAGLFVAWLTFSPAPPPVSAGPDWQLVRGGSGAAAPPFADITSPEDQPSDEGTASEIIQMIEIIDARDVELVEGVPGEKEGTGDGTDIGPGPGDRMVVLDEKPQVQRWVFKIDRIASLDDYARLLDDAGIELGVFDAAGFVYLNQASADRPNTRRPTANQDSRFYTVWQGGTLAKLDYELFAKASITASRGEVMHFFSAKLERELAKLEREATRDAGRKPHQIRYTWFGVREQSGRMEFFVSRQQFRD